MKELKFGYKCKDIVTGFEGILTSRMKHITGCDRLGITNTEDTQKFFNEQVVRYVDDGVHVELYEDETCNKIEDISDAVFKFGEKVKDKVTGFKGVVSASNISVAGDISYVISPQFNPNNRSNDGEWYDESRLEKIEEPKIEITQEKRVGGIAKPNGVGRMR